MVCRAPRPLTSVCKALARNASARARAIRFEFCKGCCGLYDAQATRTHRCASCSRTARHLLTSAQLICARHSATGQAAARTPPPPRNAAPQQFSLARRRYR